MSAGYHDSKTPEPQRDLWQTPPYVFKYYDARFNFSHDVAATATNALANCYYTEDDDALTKDWGRSAWCNPPYSDTSAWVDKAIEQTSHGFREVRYASSCCNVGSLVRKGHGAL